MQQPKAKMLTLFLFLFSFSPTFCENFQQFNNISLNVPITNFTAMKERNLIDDIFPYIQMIDASTKIPSGIGVFSLFDLGNFDECYNIQTSNFSGKYCLGTINLPSGQSIKRNVAQVHPTPRAAVGGNQFTLATCAPSYLSAEEINQFTLTEIQSEYCYSKDTEPELSNAAIATICVLAVIVGIAVVETIYDIYLYYKKQKPAHELLIAFSFLTNGKKIFATSTNPDQLLCLNGMRALSMMWVVIGHSFSLTANAALTNPFALYSWLDKVGNMYIIGATVSVDTFFLIGGLVTVYTFLKAQDKGVKFNIILYYIHRYLRLTPALGVIVLIQMNLFPYLEKSPLWAYMYSTLVEGCHPNWWKSILYIGNFFHGGSSCVGQGWYLNVDMQLFVLSPLILIPLIKWQKYTIYALYLLILAGCFIPFGIAYGKEIGTMLLDTKFMTDYYIQTYTRFGPYVIGMLLGYYIYNLKKRKEPIIIPKIWVFCLWLLSLEVMITCVYAGHEFYSLTKNPPLLNNSFYIGFNRPAWAAAVGVVIFLCVSGYGGPIDSFLSLNIFQFIMKMSYSIYLIHYGLITARLMLLKSPITFSVWNVFHLFWGDFMFSLILSVPFSLLFESPIIILEKYLFRR